MLKIDLNQKYLDQIVKIINEKLPIEGSAFIFGSRVDGTSKPTSDIDIGIEGIKDKKYLVLSLLKESLDNTTIPYFMDLVDFDDEKETKFGIFAKKNVYYIKHGQNNN